MQIETLLNSVVEGEDIVSVYAILGPPQIPLYRFGSVRVGGWGAEVTSRWKGVRIECKLFDDARCPNVYVLFHDHFASLMGKQCTGRV